MNVRLSAVSLMALASFGFTESPKVTFSGTIDADASTFTPDRFEADKAFESNRTSANHELNLNANMAFSEQVAIDVAFTSYTAERTTTGNTAPSDRWSPVVFDGLTATYRPTPDMALKFGDLTWYMGGYRYYGWHQPRFVAAVIPFTSVRGLGLEYKGFSFAGAASNGTDDYSRDEVIFNAGYKMPLMPNATLQTMGQIAVFDADKLDWTVGADLNMSGELGVHAALGIMQLGTTVLDSKEKNDPSYSVVFEPFYKAGQVDVAATVSYFGHFDENNPSIQSGTETYYSRGGYSFYNVSTAESFAPAQVLIAGEGTFWAYSWVGFGAAAEYQDVNMEIDDDESVSFGPVIKYQLGEKVAMRMFANMVLPMGDGQETAYSATTQLTASF